MGHKAHPVGLRLGLHRKWKSNWFFESKNYAKFLHLNLNIEKFFKGFLYFYQAKTLLINCQLIKLASNQLFIFVTYYRIRKKKILPYKRKWKLRKWQENLEKIFNKKKIKLTLAKSVGGKGGFFFLKKFLELSSSKNNNVHYTQFHLKTPPILQQYQIILKKFKFWIFFNSQIQKRFYLKKNSKLKFLNKLLKNNYKKKVQIAHAFFKIYTIFLKKIAIQKWTFYNLLYLKKIHLYNIKFLKNYIKIYDFYMISKLKMLLNKPVFKILRLKLNGKKPKILKIKKSKYKRYHIRGKSKNSYHNAKSIKRFLSKITNLKINLVFINALSFAKFYYFILTTKKKYKKRENFNVLKIQKIMINKFKYDAIFIKDFVYLAFIGILLKNPQCLVTFIAQQFKRLPKNRKQFRLLMFINQTLKIFSQQRKEMFGIKLQITGRLNRRNRTHQWVFKKGNLAIQTYKTRVEYAYSEGLTRSGLIGIKLWLFYKKIFTTWLKKKVLQYLYYSRYKFFLNKTIVWKTYPKHFNKKIFKSNVNFNKNSVKFNSNLHKTSLINTNFIKKPVSKKPRIKKKKKINIIKNPFKQLKTANILKKSSNKSSIQSKSLLNISNNNSHLIKNNSNKIIAIKKIFNNKITPTILTKDPSNIRKQSILNPILIKNLKNRKNLVNEEITAPTVQSLKITTSLTKDLPNIRKKSVINPMPIQNIKNSKILRKEFFNEEEIHEPTMQSQNTTTSLKSNFEKKVQKTTPKNNLNVKTKSKEIPKK